MQKYNVTLLRSNIKAEIMNQSQVMQVAQINAQIYDDESSLKVLREKGAFKVMENGEKNTPMS